MKKRRIVNLVILLSAFTFLRISAMEEIKNTECWLFCLPVDLMNYIASFLMWESSVDFIERSNKAIKEVPLQYYELFPLPVNGCFAWKDSKDEKHNNVSGVFSPDGNKVALFELSCGMCTDPLLIVIDITKEKEDERVIHNQKLARECYSCLGLSCSGNMIAVIQQQYMVTKEQQDCLAVQKLVTQEIKKFNVPSTFKPRTLSFNKQGTHVIAHRDEVKKDDVVEPNYIIFELKESSKAIDDSNLLLNYFQHDCICKKNKDIEHQS